MKDWKKIAVGLGLNLPDEALDRAAASQDGVEAAFRPLVSKIPLETEPAYVSLRQPEDEE